MTRNTISVQLDPIEASVSPEHETRHIAGDDNGERLMRVFLNADNDDNDGPGPAGGGYHRLDAYNLCPENPKTLADLPFQFLRVETDLAGNFLPDKNTNLAGISGLLAQYFKENSRAPAWAHPEQPASYSADFPYSVNNFDCDTLVMDLEDENDLLDRDFTKWVLWVGVSTKIPGPDKTHVFSHERILRVRDLLDKLHRVHEGLQKPGPGKPVAVFFAVAVSYSTRFRPSGVRPAPQSVGGMMLAPRLQDTLAFLQNMIRESKTSRPSSVSSGYLTDSDSESITSSIGPYDGPDVNGMGIDFENIENDAVNSEDDAVDSEDDSVNRDNGTDTNDNTDVYSPMDRSIIEYLRERHREQRASLQWYKQRMQAPYADRPLLNPGTTAPLPESENEGKYKEPAVDAPQSTPERAATPLPPSIFETLDTNAAKGDAIEGDLHALLPEAGSPSEEEWRKCCSFLCIDQEAHKNARALSVKVPGTDNMWVKPSQLWTAYWMLASRTERELCGGVLADVMGTGKTYVCLLVCLLRAYIGYNRAEVEREWQLCEHETKKGTGNGSIVPKQHLPKDSGDGSASIPCTCGNAMGIECYANPGGVTRRLADGLSRGASLILAPQTVLDNWVKTVKHVRLQPKYYEPVVFHSKMTKEDTVLAPAPRLRQKLPMAVRPLSSVSSDGLFPHNWTPNVLDVVHEFKPSVAKDAYPERFIFLATHTPEKLTEFFQVPVPLRRKAGTGARERKTIYACPIGIQIVDEFHKAKEDAVALAHQHKHIQTSGKTRDDFDFWAVTGTPLPSKLTDLETVTSLVQRLPEWDDPSSRHYGGRVMALHELQVAYEKAVAENGTPVQAAEFRERAERFFQCGLIKRHTEASTFFGQRIFNLQDVTAKVVVNVTPPTFRDDVGKVVARVGVLLREHIAGGETVSPTAGGEPNWDQAVRSSSLFNCMMDLEILATFPGAARLMLTQPPTIDFGLAAIRTEIRKVKDHDVTKVALFQDHLDTVVEGSAHLQTILGTLDEMAGDKQKRRQPTAAEGEALASKSALALRKKPDMGLKKLVVLCPRMGEAVFVYLALRKLRPDAHAIFVHFDLKVLERTALLRDFNRLDTGPGSQTPRVLVGTFRDVGTGNDLTVANYQILTGPLRLRSQQDQAFGRTNREGQTLRLHHRLLVAEDSPVDRIVMATQARRRIVSNPFAMDEALRLEEAAEA